MGFLLDRTFLRSRRLIHITFGPLHSSWRLSHRIHNLPRLDIPGTCRSTNDVSSIPGSRPNARVFFKLTQNSAWTVLARNNLRGAGIAAHLGAYAYGFTWASVVAFFIAMVMFCAAGGVSKRKDKHRTSRNSSTTVTTVPVTPVPVTRTSRFGRARFAPKPVVISEVDNGRIKNEYV